MSLDIKPVIDPDVPGLLPEQVGRFTINSLRAKQVRHFDAGQALAGLRRHDGALMIAVDIGGDKLSASYFTIRDGRLRHAGDILTRQGDGGAGYLADLVKLRDLAQARRLPVGISFAGPTSGTRLEAGPNLPVFMGEFQAGYDGDFAKLFSEVELANDAEAGIMAGALKAAALFPEPVDVIYVINGSGLGGAVLTGSAIYATEPGHIAVVDQLNTFAGFSQRKPCGLGGAAHVCIEAVAASKAGVEDIWSQVAGERLTGREIAARYQDGDEFARSLYRNSACITAHAVKGMAVAFGLLASDALPVIVGHGGIFQVPGYGEHVRQILGRDLGVTPRMLFTRDFSANTCLEGAAIAIAGRIA